MKYFFITLSFLCVSFFSYSQIEEELKDLINDAEYFYWNEDYEQAIPIYKEILAKDPDNAHMNYKIGMCYQLMPFEAGRSINYLEKAVKNVSSLHVDGSYKDRTAPVVALYRLGYAYHTNKYYSEALKTYSQFRDSLSVDDLYNINIVERQLLSCKTAKEISEHPVSVEIWNVGNVINTPQADFNPCVTADGKKMFFTRIVVTEEDGEVTSRTQRIFTSNRIDEERWTEPEDITDQLGAKGVCSVVSVDANGTALILYKNANLNGGILDLKGGALYYSKKQYRTDQIWPEMVLFDKTINSKANETHASFTPDGNKLYFTSDRKGGFGGLDIYVSEKTEEGWSTPKNLGPSINTPFDEETPFILSDGKTLYFASEGHYNMGGFDIFSSKMVEYGIWTEPINLGVPINSPGDNTFFAPALNGKQAYYAQARHEGYFTFGDKDIYELNMLSHEEYEQGIDVTIRGKIEFDDETPIDGSTKVLVVDAEKEVVQTIIPEADGKYKFKVPAGDYTLKFIRDGYNSILKSITVEKALVEKSISVNTTMYPNIGDSKKYYVIRNIYFNENEYSLTRASLIEVEKLKSIMLENPSLYIEVIGHTDTKGSAEANRELSRLRSRTVIDYLVNKGVEKKRFVSTAAGESRSAIQDAAPDGTSIEAMARLNRRVEIRILKTIEGAEIVVDNTPAEITLAKFNRFSVQILESEKEVDMSTFANLGADNKVMRSMIKPNTFVYYFGDYKSKADAVKAMNKAIQKGYSKAKIIDYFTLNKSNEFLITNPVPFKKKYTIQLQALTNQQIITTNPILVAAAKYKTEDGFYRYTYKEYDSAEAARDDLITIMDSGFPNAFIIEVGDLKQ